MSLTKNDHNEFCVKLENFTIRGRSTGGRETAIIIEELSVVFDLGYQPDKIEAIQNVFISHGHCDHIGSLHYCHINRRLHQIHLPWQVIMPQCYMEPFKVIATGFSSLGRGGYPKGFYDCQFVGDESSPTIKTIKPFEKLFIDQFIEAENCQDLPLINKTNYFVTAYPMKHKILSYGYVITEKRKKLKKEYLGKTGQELKNLRLSGTEIQETLTLPLIAFTGDTTIDAVLEREAFLKSQILILECTHFNDVTIKEAECHGHTHFQQIVDNIEKFQNKWIILCHLSQKYRRLSDIESDLAQLSPEQRQRIIIWL